MSFEIREIPGFDKYYATTGGEIFSRKYGKLKKLNPNTDKDGYLVVRLSKSMRVHRLVALTFLPNPSNHPNVCHKNGNNQDNHVTNLKWASQKENIHDKKGHGTWQVGNKAAYRKLSEAQVKTIKELYAEHGNQAQIARDFSVARQTIWKIVHNEIWNTV